jgi:hypothetical protein
MVMSREEERSMAFEEYQSGTFIKNKWTEPDVLYTELKDKRKRYLRS